MRYLIGAILLTVLGVFMGSSAYLIADTTLAYVMGVAASVSFLVGFLLLEYALFHYDFGSVITSWGAGIAALLTIAGGYFWNENMSLLRIILVIVTLLGVSGLIFSRSQDYA